MHENSETYIWVQIQNMVSLKSSLPQQISSVMHLEYSSLLCNDRDEIYAVSIYLHNLSFIKLLSRGGLLFLPLFSIPLSSRAVAYSLFVLWVATDLRIAWWFSLIRVDYPSSVPQKGSNPFMVCESNFLSWLSKNQFNRNNSNQVSLAFEILDS